MSHKGVKTQDKWAELAKEMQIAKLKLRDFSHSQVLTLSGKCQNFLKQCGLCHK